MSAKYWLSQADLEQNMVAINENRAVEVDLRNNSSMAWSRARVVLKQQPEGNCEPVDILGDYGTIEEGQWFVEILEKLSETIEED